MCARWDLWLLVTTAGQQGRYVLPCMRGDFCTRVYVGRKHTKASVTGGLVAPLVALHHGSSAIWG